MGGKLEIELGKRIKDLREKARMSQADLAHVAQKSVETISNFERGKTLPSVRTIGSLAKHLDCTMADFFKFNETTKPERDKTAAAIIARLKLLEPKDRDLLADFAELLAKRSRR